MFHTKDGCTLCEKAWPVALGLAERHGLGLVSVDITADPELLARHGERIPVLAFGERELGWGRLSARAVERELSKVLAEGARA